MVQQGVWLVEREKENSFKIHLNIERRAILLMFFFMLRHSKWKIDKISLFCSIKKMCTSVERRIPTCGEAPGRCRCWRAASPSDTSCRTLQVLLQQQQCPVLLPWWQLPQHQVGLCHAGRKPWPPARRLWSSQTLQSREQWAVLSPEAEDLALCCSSGRTWAWKCMHALKWQCTAAPARLLLRELPRSKAGNRLQGWASCSP